ncbi:MAG: PEP-CTERM sorting domain-containing protein [Pirellulales bacterium]|nr:PEP-CTERM sorting domain-containing protein [Pirellulales bacterium]
MNLTRRRVCPWILIACCTVAQARAADVYDAVADFSTTENTDTSRWSYRYQTGLDRNGVYPLLTAFAPTFGFSPTNPDAWLVAAESPIPVVGVNQTGGDLTYLAGDPGFPYPFTWPQGAMLVHPGPFDPGLVVVSWLSPVNAHLLIDFSFSDLDPNAGGVNWFVERNSGADTLSAGSIDVGESTGPLSLPLTAVNAGDRINFIVDPGDDHNFDSTRLTATITVVPEPSTAMLLGLSVPLLIWAFRSQKQSRHR